RRGSARTRSGILRAGVGATLNRRKSEHRRQRRRKERAVFSNLRGGRKMKQLFCTSGLVVLALAGFAANPAGAATTAAGPYYANPSWDQQLPASTRFVVLSNWIDVAHPSGGAAVLDRETGLVWEQSPSTFPDGMGRPSGVAWGAAQFYCNNLSTGGRK